MQILNEGRDLDSLNTTNIILIPKCANLDCMMKFRPISLCNVLYKLITKIIVNHFKRVLDLCIDNAQSAFVPSKLISKNILLAYEILHTFCQKRYGKKGYMAFKLVMSKAYDWVEWHFLREIVMRMGFARQWVETIMRCISCVSYSVLINGQVGECFG